MVSSQPTSILKVQNSRNPEMNKKEKCFFQSNVLCFKIENIKNKVLKLNNGSKNNFPFQIFIHDRSEIIKDGDERHRRRRRQIFDDNRSKVELFSMKSLRPSTLRREVATDDDEFIVGVHDDEAQGVADLLKFL